MIFLDQVEIDTKKFPSLEFYPFNLDVFKNTQTVSFNSAITFFSGRNGSGKSTLLEAIAKRCRIHIWQNDNRARHKKNPYENALYTALNICWQRDPVPGSFFSSRIFSDFSRNLEEWAVSDPGMLEYFGGESLLAQSHGQSLMSYFSSRCKVQGLYFLDEPETALSPQNLIRLANLLIRLGTMGNSQFIIATHSPFLLCCPQSTIYNFTDNGITPAVYKESEEYRLYKNFIDCPEKYIILPGNK